MRGEATNAKRTDFVAVQEASLAAIRYADPAAFTTAAAVSRALDAHREAVLAVSDRVGVIAISADGPVEAMAAMTQAGKEGTSSPIRFPASNAGSLCGIPSIAFGFRGPTLMLTMPPARGVPVALLYARALIARGVVQYVFIATCVVKDGQATARCVLVGKDATVTSDDEAWLFQ